MVTDGPMDGEMFLAYIREFLCPTLQPGDIVVVDNLSSHKVSGVEEAIRATGATPVSYTHLDVYKRQCST